MEDRKWILIFCFAVLAFLSGIGLLMAVIFGTIPHENQQMASVVAGFLMNTLISTVLLYFFGGNPKAPTTQPTTVNTSADTTNLTVNP